MKGLENNPKTLVCFDFDDTLVNGHFHKALVNGRVMPGQEGAYVQGLIDNIGIKNKDKLLETFKTLIKDGHNIAITSFTEYPGVVGPTLKAIGLNDDEISKIHVVGGIPLDQNAGKGGHIQKAMQHFGVTENKNVLLVDDRDRNITQARLEGYRAQEVPENGSRSTEYLDKIKDQASVMKQEALGITVGQEVGRAQLTQSAPADLEPSSRERRYGSLPPSPTPIAPAELGTPSPFGERPIGINPSVVAKMSPEQLAQAREKIFPSSAKQQQAATTTIEIDLNKFDKDVAKGTAFEGQERTQLKKILSDSGLEPKLETKDGKEVLSFKMEQPSPGKPIELKFEKAPIPTFDGEYRGGQRAILDAALGDKLDMSREKGQQSYTVNAIKEQQQAKTARDVEKTVTAQGTATPKPLASPAPPPPSIKPASPTPAPQKQEMQQQAKPKTLDKKEEKLIKKMVDKELTNLEKASGMGVIKRFQNRKVHTEALNNRSDILIKSANNAGTEIGQIAQYNKKGLETIVKQSINGPDQTAGLQRIQNNHQGINDFLKAVDPKAQERFADNSSNIFPSKRFANRAAAAFVKIDATIGEANTANIASFAGAYKEANPNKSFPKDFIDNPKLHNTLVRAATADPQRTADVIKVMKDNKVVSFDKPKDFDKVFTPVVNAVVTSGNLESAKTTMDLINSDAKRTGMAAAFRGDLDYKKVDAIARGAQPNGAVDKPIDSMSKNERLQQSAHIAATYPNVHKLAEEALKEQSETTGKEGKATNRDICKFAEGLQKQGVDLKALDSKIGADPEFKKAFKGTLTQKSETIKVDKAQEKQINAANRESGKGKEPIKDAPRRDIKPENIQQVKNHTVIDSIMKKQNKSFGRDIKKLSDQLRSEMKPASKSTNTPSSLTVNTAAKTSVGTHR